MKTATNTGDEEKAVKYNILKARYKKVSSVLSDPKFNEYFQALPYNSGYFMCLKLNDGLDGEAIRQILLEKYDTGLIHLAGIFRLAFSSVAEDKIEDLFVNIHNACRDSVS